MRPHSHDEHELAWALRGTTVVECGNAIWQVDESQALWIPAGAAHTLRREPGSLVFPVFVPQRAGVNPVPHVAGIRRTAELSRHAEALLQPLFLGVQERDAIRQELLSSLVRHAGQDAMLTLPVDPEAALVAERIRRSPADRRVIDDWAKLVSVSSKTLQRRFRQETGLSFTHWRLRARLIAARTMLARGENVASVSGQVGFSHPSAFIEAFKREFRTTPGRYASSER